MMPPVSPSPRPAAEGQTGGRRSGRRRSRRLPTHDHDLQDQITENCASLTGGSDERRSDPGRAGPVRAVPTLAGLRVGDLLFVSGQAAIDPGGVLVGVGDFDAQAEQVFRNLARVLEAGGSRLDRVVKVTIFLTDMANFGKIVELRGKWFTPPTQRTRSSRSRRSHFPSSRSRSRRSRSPVRSRRRIERSPSPKGETDELFPRRTPAFARAQERSGPARSGFAGRNLIPCQFDALPQSRTDFAVGCPWSVG
jgi:enamine deaminase RidA (YjgF/YER057c/UK114 family)